MHVILFEMGLSELGEKRKEMGCFWGSKKNLKTVTSMDGWRCMAGWIVPKGRSWDKHNSKFCSSKRRRATEWWSCWNSDNTCGDSNLDYFLSFDKLRSLKISKRPAERRFVIASLIMIAVTIMMIIIIIPYQHYSYYWSSKSSSASFSLSLSS